MVNDCSIVGVFVGEYARSREIYSLVGIVSGNMQGSVERFSSLPWATRLEPCGWQQCTAKIHKDQ